MEKVWTDAAFMSQGTASANPYNPLPPNDCALEERGQATAAGAATAAAAQPGRDTMMGEMMMDKIGTDTAFVSTKPMFPHFQHVEGAAAAAAAPGTVAAAQ